MNNVHDLEDDAARYVAEALKITGTTLVELDTLVDNYEMPKPNNLSALRQFIREDIAQHDGRLDDYDIKMWLIEKAVEDIERNNPLRGRKVPA